jgi:hypothetical protein
MNLNIKSVTSTFTSLPSFNLSKWIGSKVEAVVVYAVEWAFSKPSVQKAFLENIDCDSPIGRSINRQIEAYVEDDRHNGVDADDVTGLDRYIENALENLEVEMDSVQGLESHVENAIDRAIENLTTENIEGFSEAVAEVMEENLDYAAITKQVTEEIVARLTK